MEHSTPTCLGFIMDGNRRWAREQGMSSIEGHLAGRQALKDTIDWVKERHIPHVVFYAFSTENWKRSETEVSQLMELFKAELASFDQAGVNVRIVGRVEDFTPDLQSLIKKVEQDSESTQQTTVWLALSYGGRAELVAAANQAIEKGVPVTEATFEALLWTAELPDPDMIIRTGGEQRLSNFLTWKSTYSELYFIDTYWPALTRSDLDDILVEYASRQRRRGK